MCVWGGVGEEYIYVCDCTMCVSRLLAPYIGVDEMDQENIRKEGTISQQNAKLMQVWRNKYKDDATYHLFVRGCERAQRSDLVNVVNQLLKKNPTACMCIFTAAYMYSIHLKTFYISFQFQPPMFQDLVGIW